MPEDTDITAEELTVQDILDEANQVGYHTILEVWREVLRPAQKERFVKITPQWANRICSSYREIQFRDMPRFRDLYFDKIAELGAILDGVIDSDDECLNMTSAEEDVQHNSANYLNILIDWQRAFLMWELEWDCTDMDAAVNLAAISEVHRMFFDEKGLTNLLDQIQFQITDADRELLAQSLQELKEAQEGQ
jgi:hypothetical protein